MTENSIDVNIVPVKNGMKLLWYHITIIHARRKIA